MTPTEVVQQQFEALNRRDRAGWCAAGAPDVSFDPEGVTGVDVYGEVYDVLVEAFPDIQAKILSSLEQGDLMACEVVFSGTHTGVLHWPTAFDETGLLGDVAPTGKTMEVRFGNFCTVRGDKIVTDNTYGVSIGVANALGVNAALGTRS